MLLCSVLELEPEQVLGASVLHPRRPDTELLRAGVVLDAAIIARLHSFEVHQVWINHDATRDLDHVMLPRLDSTQVQVYQQLKSDFSRLATTTISTGQVQTYRQTITELVFQITSGRNFARLGSTLAMADGPLFTHSANVAYLAILAGLELEAYIVRERPRMAPGQARDLVALGLGGLLHDIGKAVQPMNTQDQHEIHLDPGHLSKDYLLHTVNGYRLLADARIVSSAKHCVLHHHQRFNGTGWPAMPRDDRRQPLAGSEIHIFTRIVSAANALDALLHEANGRRRPAVAALRDFYCSNQFDGWFDPVIRECMVRKIPPFPVGSLVTLSDQRRAVVVSPNPHQPCRPSVRELRAGGDEANPVIELHHHPEVRIITCAGENVEPYLFDLPETEESIIAHMTNTAKPAA